MLYFFSYKFISRILFYKLNYKKEWKKCNYCKSFIFFRKFNKNLNICYKCGFHFNIFARSRINFILKKKYELYNYILPCNFLKFIDSKSYYSRLVESQMLTSEIEALLIFKGKINLFDILICVFEFNFISGSMGRAVGEKFFLAVKFCIKYNLPLICFCSSGGARMQESTVSLIQMIRTNHILNSLKNKNIPYISILINPCFGGVSASFAFLGDVNISEPNSLIGFTGPKIIKEFLKIDLPDDFQKSEILLKEGFLDFITDRKNIKKNILDVLKYLLK